MFQPSIGRVLLAVAGWLTVAGWLADCGWLAGWLPASWLAGCWLAGWLHLHTELIQFYGAMACRTIWYIQR